MKEIKINLDKLNKPLTYYQCVEFVDTVANACFNSDGEVEYNPFNREVMTTKMLAKFFTDFEFTDETRVDDYYPSDLTIGFPHSEQLSAIDKAIDKKIEFLLNNINNDNNSKIVNLVDEILRVQLENEKIQQKVLKDAEKINDNVSVEDIKRITDVLEQTNKNFTSKDAVDSVVKGVKETMTKNNLQDHKKSTKKTTSKKVVKTTETDNVKSEK